MKYLSPKQVYSRIGWFMCAMEAIVMFVAMLLSGAAAMFGREMIENMNVVLIINAVSQYVFAIPLFALCMSTLDGKAKKEKSSLGIGGMATAFIICFSLTNLTNFINVAFSLLFQAVTGHEMKSNIDSLLSGVSILMVVTTVILAPVFEELVFRYLILNKLRRYGDKTAIIVTALLFGLFHMNFEQGIYAFAIGLVFGYVVCKTGRVINSMILHALINFFCGVLPLMIEKLHSPVAETIYMSGYFILILVGIVLLILNYKKVKLEPGIEYVQYPTESFFVNPGMLVYVIVSVIIMICTLIYQIASAL